MFRLNYINGNGQEVGFAVIPDRRKKRGVSHLRIHKRGAFEASMVGKDRDVRRDIETPVSLYVLLVALLGVM